MRVLKPLLVSLCCLIPAVSMAKSPDKGWKADVELGFVNTSGNSDTTSFKTRSTLKYHRNKWRYDAELEAFNAESDGNRTAESYFLSNRVTYDFSPNNYIFGFTSYENNRFTGFDYKATAAFGYGRRLIDREQMYWDAEAGPGYRRSEVREEGLGEEDSDELILRAASQFHWKFSPSASFEQRLSVESGDDNTVTRSTTSLTSNLVGNLAMKFSYLLTYTNNVPSDRKHADTQTALTLVYTF